MRLSNHGWGTKEFLISAAIIFALLLFISFEVNMFYRGIDNTNMETNVSKTTRVNTSYYTSYEKKVSDAALTYIKDNNVPVPDAGETVYINDLIDMGYLNRLYDYYSNKSCTGYAIVIERNYNLSVKSYINCTNYVTEGY